MVSWNTKSKICHKSKKKTPTTHNIQTHCDEIEDDDVDDDDDDEEEEDEEKEEEEDAIVFTILHLEEFDQIWRKLVTFLNTNAIQI